MLHFGHQTPQWTRNRNPKKFLRKRKIATGNTLERKTWDFNPVRKSKHSQQHLNKEMEQTVKQIRKKNITQAALLTVLALVITVAVYSVFQAASAFSAYAEDNHKQRMAKEIREVQENEDTYNYLTNRGYKLFRVGKLNSAEAEFKLAINIYPERTDANIGLAKALAKECVEDFKNCLAAELQIKKVIELTAENEEMHHLLFLVRLAPELKKHRQVDSMDEIAQNTLVGK